MTAPMQKPFTPLPTLLLAGACALLQGAAVAGNASVPGTVSTPHPTLQNIAVEWAFSGDDNANAQVSVRYRVKGTDAWLQGLPLMRVQAGSAQGYSWRTRHSGSVFDVKSNTTYELRLSLDDPDGGSAQRSVTVTTRKRPKAAEGGTVRRATPSNLSSVINATKPGDVVELGNGSYSFIDWTADGTADRPVVLRAAAGAEVNGEIYMYKRRHVIIDGVTVNGRIRFNASNFVSIINSRINAQPGIGDGFGIVAYLQSEDAYIADNVVTGSTRWREPSFGESGDNVGDGIALGGPGHVVTHNRVSGFRDDISLLDLDESANQYSIDILNNDLSVAGDDGIEADFCRHNCRVMRNRLTNVFVGTSSQPSLGGPSYFIRNVMYNVVHVPFKLNNGSTGNYILHNTVVKNGDAYAVYSGEQINRLFSRNNLMIGGPGGTYNGYTSGSGRALEMWDLVEARADMDFDALGSTLAGFSGHFGGTAFNSLGQLQNWTTEADAREIDLNVFARSIAYPASPPNAYAVPDLRLKAGGRAIDAGVRLNNINAGVAGDAPDAGAYEYGKALPVYGPR
jgi:hypothetical protein